MSKEPIKIFDQYSINGSFKTNNIFDGPPTLTYKGVGEQKHLFLVHEGSNACHNCMEAVCLYCRGSINGIIFCLSCLVTESIVPEYGSVGSKTISEMHLKV